MHKQYVLAERPKGDVTDQTFRLETVETPTEGDLQDGQILVRVLSVSLDPAMRGWLRDVRSYLPPVGIGEVMRASGIAVVEGSKSQKFRNGDLVYALTGWTEYAVLPDKSPTRKIDPPSGALPTDYIGILGDPGQTAYHGLVAVGKVKAGEVVVVSGAAGAVGSAACQFAMLMGCKVYAIAGSDDKCEWLRSIGVVDALNYKSSTFRDDFRKKWPLINVYFDNVGGEILDLALTRLAFYARIAACGSISSYNKPVPIRNYGSLTTMRATMQGFIVFDYAKQYREAERQIAEWLGQGKLQRKETRLHGIERCVEGLRGLFKGDNTGKYLVQISELDTKSKL